MATMMAEDADSDRDSFKLDLNDFSDGEDLLAQFTKEDAVARAGPPYGRLLQVDSNSDATPKLKGITKEELDQSRARFRLSLNELRSSSPISPKSLEQGKMQAAELARIGSKLSEQLLTDINEMEGPNGTRNEINMAKDQENMPRRMTTEELKSLQARSFHDPKPIVETTSRASPKVGPNLGHRVLWAISVVVFFIAIDMVLTIIVARQEAGLPAIDFGFFEEWLDFLRWFVDETLISPRIAPF